MKKEDKSIIISQLSETIKKYGHFYDTDYWKKDLDEIMQYRPDLIMLPKSATADDILTVSSYMSETEKKYALADNTVNFYNTYSAYIFIKKSLSHDE